MTTGKMFGLKKNYIIAEGELKPNTDEERDKEMEEEVRRSRLLLPPGLLGPVL